MLGLFIAPSPGGKSRRVMAPGGSHIGSTRKGRRWPGAFTVQVVFAALVVATVGAFFGATRLKRSPPVVEKLTFARHFSPNGDGRRDVVRIAFRNKRADQVTVALVARGGEEVRTLARDRELGAGRHRFGWDGRTDAGGIARDGEYHVEIGLRQQGRTVTSPRKLFLDTRPPRAVVQFVSPDFISPDGVGSANRARLRFAGPLRARPTLLVHRTDLRRPRLVARRVGQRGSAELSWNGSVGFSSGHRRAAPSGNYLLGVRTSDAAGNVNRIRVSPRGRIPGHPGVVVRYIAAAGPRTPVLAGGAVKFEIANDMRRYRWSVRRLRSRRVLERGSSRSRRLRLRAPRGHSGVFLLRLRSGRHRYETPFAVQARRRQRLLVVLPVATWYARNPVDANGDGFADLLPRDRKVSLRVPFAGGRPPGFSADAALLSNLDRAGRRYDLTTDLALALGRGRALARYRGVLFAGSPRFAPAEARRLLRSYVEARGRLAWLGTGGFTRLVERTPRVLKSLPAPSGANLFGERVRLNGAGLLTVLRDRIDFFAGVGGAFGPFAALEESRGLPPGARLLASAGHEAGRPSVVIYRLGRGVVARVGVDGFARSLATSGDLAQIMRRLWILLSR